MKNKKDSLNIRIKGTQISSVLDNHTHWLNEDCDHWQSMHADLNGAKLHNADLCNIVLKYAYAEGADFHNSILLDSNFSNANLKDADFHNADLRGANFRYADLRYVNLCNADLRYANLCGADLRSANLHGADLRGANLCEAKLTYIENELIEYRRGKILSDSTTGYEQCLNNTIATLEIPEGAVVFSIDGNKCRANKAKIISIDGSDEGLSHYNHRIYHVGDEIIVNDFNCEYNNTECVSGIYFFTNLEQAKNYY